MTRAEVVDQLREWVREWALDPHDAALILDRVGDGGVDTETLGDYLDGAGYPELAERAYGLAS